MTFYLTISTSRYEEDVVEMDKELLDHVIRSTTRDEDGRLVMPLMWDTNTVLLIALLIIFQFLKLF